MLVSYFPYILYFFSRAETGGEALRRILCGAQCANNKMCNYKSHYSWLYGEIKSFFYARKSPFFALCHTDDDGDEALWYSMD